MKHIPYPSELSAGNSEDLLAAQIHDSCYIRGMNYEQTLEFLYKALPMYQRVGAMAFKKDLSNTLKLCEVLGNPQDKFKSVHVAGTNGKGSSSHSIAAVLQQAGYKTALYTSPHLKSFTERIRINGNEVGPDAIVNFVADHRALIEEIQPSFFEMTVVMAFDNFAREEVDIAVIEVGLGGRLDSTNVITPEVGLITNIGLDHTDMLGETLAEIAIEKAGIIKKDVPIVIGATQNETKDIFSKIAIERETIIEFADQVGYDISRYDLDLKGSYQKKNIPGVLSVLSKLSNLGYNISPDDIKSGLKNVISLTGLKGRWQKLGEAPLVICDTGHNMDAFDLLMRQISDITFETLHMVMGFVNDKNISSLLEMLPSNAHMYFCKANVPRAMDLDSLRAAAKSFFPHATYISDVNQALNTARASAKPNDLIFVGGSTFVVAELDNL